MQEFFFMSSKEGPVPRWHPMLYGCPAQDVKVECWKKYQTFFATYDPRFEDAPLSLSFLFLTLHVLNFAMKAF